MQPFIRHGAATGYASRSGNGFRFQVIKDGSDVPLYSKSGAEYTDRLRGMCEAFTKLPTQSAILDGELCLINPRGGAHFYRLMHQMRTRWPEEGFLMLMAFDLLHQDGVDLRGLPLSGRKRDLARLCRKARVLRQVETFPDGAVLLASTVSSLFRLDLVGDEVASTAMT